MTPDSPKAGAGAAPGRPVMWPLAVLAGLILLAYVLDLHHLLSLEALREHRQTLAGLVAAHGGLAAGAYVALYAVVTGLGLPGAFVLTVAGGFLFGTLLGPPLAVTGATLGATALFLLARGALGDRLRARDGGLAARVAEGFRADALSYLLVLRLVPLFPFFAVNIACGIVGIPLRTYLLGTILGIIPGCLVYATFGAGLGSVLDRGETPSPADILTSEILVALLGLAALSLAPAIHRHLKDRKPRNDVPRS